MKSHDMKKIVSILVLSSLPFLFLFSQSEEAQQIFEHSNPGVISLVAFGGENQIIAEGTAFAIEEGVVATAYQLISRANNVEGQNIKGKKVKIEGILAIDKNLNIALLGIKGKVSPLTLGDSDQLEKEKKIFAVGSNENSQITIEEGAVKSLIPLKVNQRVIETSFALPQNFSGAPVLDENGKVMGMLVFFERRLNFTLPSNLLKTVQKQNLIKFKQWQPEDYLESLEGAYLLGRIASLLDETGRAQMYLEKVVQTKPDDIEAQALLASVYNRQRNYEKAISAYQKVIGLDENRDDAYLNLGIVYLRMSRFKESIPHLEKAVELNLDHKEAYYHIGTAYEEIKDYAKAAENYEKYLNSNPENPGDGYFHLGICRINLEQYEEAIAAFKEALKEKPQDIKINYQLAQAHQKAGQYENAEEIYRMLAQLTPEEAQVYYRTILKMYDDAGASEKAIEAAKKLIELNPTSDMDIYNLGLMYMKLNRYDEAIAAFKKAVEINPGSEYTYMQIGYIYYKQKKYREAINTYKQIVGFMPENSDAWYMIGINSMFLKNYDAAIEPLQKTIELRPDNANALYNLGICYLNIRPYDRLSAVEVYKKLKVVDPSLAAKLLQFIQQR